MSKEVPEPRDSVENVVEVDNDAVSEAMELGSETVTVMLSISVVVVTDRVADVVSVVMLELYLVRTRVE
ncbi:hypothetical protein N0V84_007632 [Fusarium piperis]|uniref:Uncharacterized protein n=1 Tax=Fusarium piperis TaxID=1435070 RepID=A0A9W9BL83_9HYPO|nr:hypothetical protein N0V84_007632 [Fusarium piperis]